MLSPSSSFMSTNCPERILSTNFLGRTSPAGDKITPPEGGKMERGEESGCNPGTVVVGGAAQRRGGTAQAAAEEETAGTEVEEAEHVVYRPSVGTTATHVNRPGGGSCPRP